MEVAMELEDDLFFADLSKQISLLVMDDDEDPVANYPSVSFQDFSRANYPIAPSPFMYEQRRESKGTGVFQSKGTGVFIPRSSQPRRKQRQGRQSSFNSKSHGQQDNTRMASRVSCNNSLYSRKSN